MTEADGSEARYRADGAVHAVDVDDEVLIWDARTEELHRLNPSAAVIWHALSSWRTTEELSADLTVGAGADRARVGHDVAECVAGLAQAGLIERQPDRADCED